MTNPPAATPTAALPRPRLAVLLVDDQRFVGVALGRLLAGEADIELHCCYQGADALARASEIRPTLILQDLMMPGLDGMTLVGSYRSNPITAGTPIIVLSANDDAASRARALAAGATDYIVKLPDRDTLVACLRRHASGQDNAEPSSDPRVGDTPTHDTFDPMVLITFMQGLPGDSGAFMLSLIDQFLQEATSRVATLQQAARRADQPTLRATAHSLKGSSMIMGAKRLAALCARVEDQLDRLLGDGVASALVAAIDEELGAVRTALTLQRQDIAQSTSHDTARAPS